MNNVPSTNQEGKCPSLNFAPDTPTFVKGQGIYLWDDEGKRYFDFLGAFGGVGQGHCHPRITETVKKQVDKLTLTSRAFFTDALGEYAVYITKLFGYDKVVPLNSGAQACETAVKIARKWGYLKKNIPDNQAKIVFAENNFWGHSLAAISASTEPSYRKYVGPLLPGFIIIPYDDLHSLEKVLKEDPNICAFMIEPLQGEGGFNVPSKGYLKGVRELCTKYNVLWIDDEVQTGLGRTGKFLAVDHEDVKPDILCLGKALSGGMMAASAVLADESVMLKMTATEHGSTFSANALACKTAITALKVIIEEKLPENALRLESVLRSELEKLPKTIVKEIRGKGLMFAIALKEGLTFTAMDVCKKLSDNGLLTKPIKATIIRLSPPLIITEEQLLEGINIISNTLKSFCN